MRGQKHDRERRRAGDAELAERIEQVAFPGLTANFDAGRTAALAMTLGEWLVDGPEHAAAMLACATRLADELTGRSVPVVRAAAVATRSHAFAIDARELGGGMAAARQLRVANLLTSAIGLPSGVEDGLRVGVNELVRIGMAVDDMPELAHLMSKAWSGQDPEPVAADVGRLRSRFGGVCFTGDGSA